MSAMLGNGWERFMAQRWLLPVLIAVGLALAFAIPEYNLLNKYIQLVMMYVGINIILTVSLNLVNGYMGEFSLAHAGFMAVGAYTAALLTQSSLPPASLPTWHADLLRPLFGGMPSWPAQPLDLTELERALRRCRRLEAPAKRTVLDLCARTVACDGQLHLREYELVRVIAQAIGCPLPLLQGVITT